MVADHGLRGGAAGLSPGRRAAAPGRAAWAWLAVTLGLVVRPAMAQTPFSYHWGPRDGLVQYTVSSIAQDSRGYVWLGTESGASRFNGRTFESLTLATGFTNEAVQAILPQGDAVLLLSESGALFEAHGTEVSRIQTRGRPRALAPDPAGGAPWLVGEDGLSRLGGGEEAPFPPGVLPGPEERLVHAVVEGRLMLALGSTVVTLVDGRLQPTRHFDDRVVGLLPAAGPGFEVVLPDRLVRVTGDVEVVMWQAPPGVRLACATRGPGRRVVGTTSGALAVVGDSGAVELLSHGLPANAVMTVLVDREDNLWAGLDSGGLLLLPRTVLTSYTAADGVGTGDVFHVVADRVRGGVWVGTRNGGAAHVRGGVVRPLTEAQGLPSRRVRALHQTRRGDLLIGTVHGIAVLDAGDRLRVERPPCGAQFRFFTELPSGEVVAGSQEGALVRLAGEQATCLDTGALPQPAVLYAAQWHRGELYVASSRGVFRVVGDELVGPSAAGADVRMLAEDREGSLWATSRNLGAWRLRDGAWQRFGEAEGFDAQMRYVEVGPDGRVWFSGERGVWAWPDVRRTRVTSREGLGSDNVYLLRFDPLGQLWVGSDRGLNLLRDGRVAGHFDYRDGLADNELNANGFAVDERGWLWFCTMRGVSTLDPRALKGRAVAPLLDLRGVEVNDEPVALRRRGGSLTPLRLSHDQSSLRFTFSGQSFRNPQRVTYTYLLEGFDERWSRPTAVEWAQYSRLPPRRYVFRVQCSTPDGATSEPQSLELEVVPALWQRTSFRLALVALGLGAMAGLVHWRVRRMRERNAELERLVDARTGELAAANEQLHLIAITDPLTGTYNRRFFEEDLPTTLAATLRSFRNAVKGEEVARSNCHLGFFMLDLDHFKLVNDAWGHEVGDVVLRTFAELVRGAIRTSDTLFRWGGEEFAVLARNTNPAEVRVLAERLRAAVAAHRFEAGGGSLAVSCSIGFATYPFLDARPTAVAAEGMVELADRALYLAKAAGRDCFVGVRAGHGTLTDAEMARVRGDLLEAWRGGLVTLDSSADLTRLSRGPES